VTKTDISFPTDNRNPEKLAGRVKKDLTWILFSLVAALAASIAAYTLL